MGICRRYSFCPGIFADPVHRYAGILLLERIPHHHFHPLQAGSFSLQIPQESGAMQILLRPGIALRQGTFSAVIAPERIIISALNTNPELSRFLFLYICGNYSRIISHIGRSSAGFEVRRPFTADQLLAVIRDAGHTIIFIEHDATIFDSAERLIEPVGSALIEAGREALVVLYSPAMDRSFAALARRADRLIEIVNSGEPDQHSRPGGGQSGRRNPLCLPAQTTLEVR